MGQWRCCTGVSIDIADGEFVILVGPSGCGKSTLLRMVAGLEEITAGKVRIETRVVNNLPAKERDIAMVFQNYALYPHMTVRQNMEFGLKLRRAPRTEIDAKVNRASGILGLDALLERLPRELSGGQRQRVAMGRAIVRDPQVFLFDEPLSNLDAKLRVHMRTEIKALHQRLGSTIVYVTHDQVEAMTMADKIVVMHDGIIEQQGAPLELYDRPANLFVAQFIGSPSMNVIAGQFATDGSATVKTQSGLRVPVPAVPPGRAGQAVSLGIRPEHIRLDPAGVPATIVVIEPTGAETQLTMDVQGSEMIAVLHSCLDARPGDVIGIAADPHLLHLFEAEGGARIDVHMPELVG